MICERCGGDSGPYRVHPDPYVCQARLEAHVEELGRALVAARRDSEGEVARLTAELRIEREASMANVAELHHADAELGQEREAHAQTKKELASRQERLRWFEMAGGVRVATRVHEEYARADRVEADLKAEVAAHDITQQELSKVMDRAHQAEAILRDLRAWLRARCGSNLTAALIDGWLDQREGQPGASPRRFTGVGELERTGYLDQREGQK